MNTKLTTNDVARLLDMAPPTVLYHERMGRLKAERTQSGIRLFDLAEVEAFAKMRKQKKAAG
jgi:DNA-binding transcriptional MerR regulator